MVNNAIILAAGQGTRAKNLTKGVPKGFIKINGEYIIETSIKKLVKLGISNICIVYGKEHYKWKELKRKYPFLILIQNEKWNDPTTGSFESLKIGMEYFHSDCLILESDIIYQSKILFDCIHASNKNVLMCTPFSPKNNKLDEFYITTNKDIVSNMGKELHNKQNVFIGISKIEYQNFFKYKEYESIFLDNSATIISKQYLWQEIDNLEQYILALKISKNISILDYHFESNFLKSNKILLNPGPLTTSYGVKQSLLCEDICPREKEFGEAIQEIRKNLVEIYYKPKYPRKKETKESLYQACLFAGSGTLAVESTIISNTTKKDTNLIFINGDNHQSYSKRIQEIHDAYGFKYSLVYLDNNSIKLQNNWNPINNHFKGKYRDFYKNVFIVHHETSNGQLNNVNEITKQIKQLSPKTNIIVDAMSSFGEKPIDIKNIDFLISSSNKILGGVPGISFVICNKHKVKKSKGSYYMNLYDNLKHQNDNNGQFRFTPPIQVLYGLRQALREYNLQEFKFNNLIKKYDYLQSKLLLLNFKILDFNLYNSKILMSIVIPDWMNFQDYHDFLYKKNITVYPGKNKSYFRISVMGNIDTNDIETFINYTKQYIDENRLKNNI